jgi:hypothetical protein
MTPVGVSVNRLIETTGHDRRLFHIPDHFRDLAMSPRWVIAFVAGFCVATASSAADLKKASRTIAKEPAYQTKAPEYLLLVFGPDANERVWIVRDGDTLYVDRNGNGDLTDPGEAIPTKKRDGSDPDVDGRSFDVGDITVGGRTHKSLVVGTGPLASMVEEIRNQPHARELLKADPKTQIATLTLEVRHQTLKGPGVDGRVPVMAGPIDLDGMLVFGKRPQDAPIVYPDGPRQITFYAIKPDVQLGREADFVLTVGSPGLGNGTLAMLAYDKVIPPDARPTLEINYPPAKAGDPPVKEQYELKDRC